MKLLKKNIRVHKSFVVPQGACSDGNTIYCVYEREHKYHIIVQYDKKGKMLRKSGKLKIGHGNDMTYKAGKLYITHSKRKDVIHVVDAKTLKKVDDIKIAWNKRRGFNEITAAPKGFFLRTIKGNRLVWTDNEFKKLHEFKFGHSLGTAQGMEYHGKKIYRGFSHLQTKGANYIGVYDPSGDLIKKKKVKFRGELESVFWLGGHLYGIIYRKYRKKGKKRYIAKLFRV